MALSAAADSTLFGMFSTRANSLKPAIETTVTKTAQVPWPSHIAPSAMGRMMNHVRSGTHAPGIRRTASSTITWSPMRRSLRWIS